MEIRSIKATVLELPTSLAQPQERSLATSQLSQEQSFTFMQARWFATTADLLSDAWHFTASRKRRRLIADKRSFPRSAESHKRTVPAQVSMVD